MIKARLKRLLTKIAGLAVATMTFIIAAIVVITTLMLTFIICKKIYLVLDGWIF